MKFADFGRTVGIYAIRCKRENRVYIGQSTDIQERIFSHYRDLLRGSHVNRVLQEDFEKYGESAFDIEIVERCDEDELADAEIKTMEVYFDYGYLLYNRKAKHKFRANPKFMDTFLEPQIES